MKFSTQILSQTITQLCLAKEIDHIVISPGSRNAPLTIGFTEHPAFTNFSIVDERCAAFFALGLAQQLQKPVALVCTSGSALLNYYPAIAEAFYSDIPLVVISADRPKELLEIGDGQTILQENVFKNHILYSANCVDGASQQLYNETEINIALNTAIELRGPVHINAPFAEPLYKIADDTSVRPQHVPARRNKLQPPEDFKDFITAFSNYKKKLVLVGVLPPNSIEQKWIDILAADQSVVVLTETTSNLHHPKFFPAIDQLIACFKEEDFLQLQPELLITFGGMVVSKKIKGFLRKFSPKEHWHVDGKRAYDTYFALTDHMKLSPQVFLEQLLPKASVVKSNFQEYFLALQKHRLARHELYLQQIPFSDFKVFSFLFKSVPKHSQLQLANSATIRYAQLFDLDASLSVYCNRGTSGIDGSTSTAIGAAYTSKKPTVFITGDLSFFYDSNALWNNYLRKDFRIIIVNNAGGGIFRILPGARQTEKFTTFFETRHQLTALQLCTMFNLGYTSAHNEEELAAQLHHFYLPSERPKVLEIFTPSEVNDKVLLEYFEFVR